MAGSAVIGTLRAILSLDTAQFETASARVSQSAKTWTRDFNSIGQQATKLGQTLTTAITLPLVGLGAGAAKLAMDFESSFAGVRKTVNATEPEFQAMAAAFRDLSKQIPVNVNELNKLGEAAGALGIPKEDIVDFTRVMALLGVTTNLTSEQAATSIGKIQNIFGAAGKDTENFASALVALGNAGASTETEIVEMAARIAGAGNAIGISQAEVLGFASTLASVGINAEAGGSAISRVFLKMNDAVMAGGGHLAEFARVAGMSSAQFKAAFETDAAGAVTTFIKGLGSIKASGENVNGTIEGLVGKNIILKDTLLRVSGAGQLLSDQLHIGNQAWKDNTALTAEAEKRFDTTASQLTLLWNKVKDVGITLGNALLPAIKEAVKWFDNLVPYLESAAKWFGELNPKVQMAAVGFLGLVAAAGPALLLFGQMSIGLGSLTAAFTKTGIATKALSWITGFFAEGTVAAGAFTTAIEVMTGPVGWIIGAAAGIVTATGSWDELFRILKAGAAVVTDVVVIAFDELAFWGGKLVDWVMGLPLLGGLLDAFGQVLRVFGAAIEWAFGMIATGLEKLHDLLSGLREVSSGFSDISAKDIASPFKKLIGEGLGPALTAEEALARAHADEMKSAQAANKVTEQSAAEKKKAAAEAKKHAEAIERENKALEALIPSQKGVNELIVDLTEREAKLTARGVPLVAALQASEKELKALQARAKAAGVEFDYLNALILDYDRRIRELSPAHRELNIQLDGAIAKLTQGTTSMKLMSSASVFAKYDALDLAGAYSALGITTSTELHKAAASARDAYALIASSGTATAAQLIDARKKVVDAEVAAGERTIGIWEKSIKPAVLGVMESIVGSVSSGLVDLIGHWERHGEIFKRIWQDIKTTFLNVLDDMLSSFLNNFLKGLINGILGAKLGERLAGSLLGLVGLGGAIGGGSAIGGVVPAVADAALGGGAASGGASGVGGAVGFAAAEFAVTQLIFDQLVPGFWTQVFGGQHFSQDTSTLEEQYQAVIGYAGKGSQAEQDFLERNPGFQVPSFSTGTFGKYVDFGAGTLAWLHGREKITPEGAEIDSKSWASGAHSTIIFEEDGRQRAQYMAPFLVDEVVRLRLA